MAPARDGIELLAYCFHPSGLNASVRKPRVGNSSKGPRALGHALIATRHGLHTYVFPTLAATRG